MDKKRTGRKEAIRQKSVTWVPLDEKYLGQRYPGTISQRYHLLGQLEQFPEEDGEEWFWEDQRR